MARPQPIPVPRRLYRGEQSAAFGGAQAATPVGRTGLEPSEAPRIDPVKAEATGSAPPPATVVPRVPDLPTAPSAQASAETPASGAALQAPRSLSATPAGTPASDRPAQSGPPEKVAGALPLLAHMPDVQALVDALRRWPEAVDPEPDALEPDDDSHLQEAGQDQIELIPALAAPTDNSGIDPVLLDKIESVLRHASRVLAASADFEDSNRLEADGHDRFDVSELAPLLAPAGMLKGVRVYVQRVGGAPSLVIAPREDPAPAVAQGAATSAAPHSSGTWPSSEAPSSGFKREAPSPANGRQAPPSPVAEPALEASPAPAGERPAPSAMPAASVPEPQAGEAAPSMPVARTSARSLLRNILLKGVQDG